MDKVVFIIDKKSFPYRFEVYVLQTLIFTFFGFTLIFKDVILWLILTTIYNLIHFFLTSHNWFFYSDRVEINFIFRRKKVILPYNKIYFHASNGTTYSGHFKIFIKFLDKNKLFVPYWMYYSNPDDLELSKLKQIAIDYKIKISGEWD